MGKGEAKTATDSLLSYPLTGLGLVKLKWMQHLLPAPMEPPETQEAMHSRVVSGDHEP